MLISRHEIQEMYIVSGLYMPNIDPGFPRSQSTPKIEHCYMIFHVYIKKCYSFLTYTYCHNVFRTNQFKHEGFVVKVGGGKGMTPVGYLQRCQVLLFLQYFVLFFYENTSKILQDLGKYCFFFNFVSTHVYCTMGEILFFHPKYFFSVLKILQSFLQGWHPCIWGLALGGGGGGPPQV